MKEVVNVRTQEQWNEVVEFYKLQFSNNWKAHKEDSCIRYKFDYLYGDTFGWSSKSCYIRDGYVILTFEDWKRKHKGERKMTKHKHAKLMVEYAKDAMETDEPWKKWEVSENGGKTWHWLSANPIWTINGIYRRKRKTININGFEVPEPERKPLNSVIKYYTPDLIYSDSYSTHTWCNDDQDLRWLKPVLFTSIKNQRFNTPKPCCRLPKPENKP